MAFVEAKRVYNIGPRGSVRMRNSTRSSADDSGKRVNKFWRKESLLTLRSSQRPRSPTHPNYKEEEYELSTVVLRYVGHPGMQS